MFEKQKEWVTKHKKIVGAGTLVTMIGIGVYAFLKLNGHDVDLPTIETVVNEGAAKRPELIQTDLEIPEEWKYVLDYWTERQGDEEAVLINAYEIPVEEVTSFIEQIKPAFDGKDKFAIFVSGR